LPPQTSCQQCVRSILHTFGMLTLHETNGSTCMPEIVEPHLG